MYATIHHKKFRAELLQIKKKISVSVAYHDAALPIFQGSCGVSGSEMGQQKAKSTNKEKDVLQVYLVIN